MGCGAARGQFVGGFFFIAISLRHPQEIEVFATSLLSKMAISPETSSESVHACIFALHEKLAFRLRHPRKNHVGKSCSTTSHVENGALAADSLRKSGEARKTKKRSTAENLHFARDILQKNEVFARSSSHRF